jgi:excisionase family DNA binding protein
MAAQPRKTTPSPMPDQEILNIDGAAAFLGVSVKTFSKVLREGDVPGRKVGREWKFSRQALVEWVGRCTARDFLDGSDTAEPEDAAESGAPPRGGARPGAGGGAPLRESQGSRRRKVNDGFSVDEI